MRPRRAWARNSSSPPGPSVPTAANIAPPRRFTTATALSSPAAKRSGSSRALDAGPQELIFSCSPVSRIRRSWPRKESNMSIAPRTRTTASIVGPFLLVLGAALALRSTALVTIVSAIVQNDALLLLICIVTLAIGLTLVGLHNLWNTLPAIVISLFGWLTAVRGAAMLLFPHSLTEIWSRAVTPQLGVITGAAFALIGLWLTYVGWVHHGDAHQGHALKDAATRRK